MTEAEGYLFLQNIYRDQKGNRRKGSSREQAALLVGSGRHLRGNLKINLNES